MENQNAQEPVKSEALKVSEVTTRQSSTQSLPELPSAWVTLKQAGAFCWKNFWNFFAVTIGFFLLFFVGEFLFIFILTSYLNPVLMTIVLVLLALILLAFGAFAGGTLLSYITKKESDATITFKESCENGRRLLFPIMWAVVLCLLIVEGFGLLFIIPGIIFQVYLMFTPFAVVIDNKKGFDAIFSSYAAVKGSWWKVFGYLLFIGLIIAGCWIVVVMLFALLNGVIFSVISSITANIIISVIVALLGIAILLAFIGFGYPLAIAYLYLVYSNLKQRKASTFDTELSQIKAKRRTLFIVFSVIGLIVYAAQFPLDYLAVSSAFNKDSGADMGSFFQQGEEQVQPGIATTTLQAQPYVDTTNGQY
jgi:MFS family permease